jgi:hypothetical protein
VLENGSVAIKVNNVIGHYFLSHKEVRHEDPFSPPFYSMLWLMCLQRWCIPVNKIIGLQALRLI